MASEYEPLPAYSLANADASEELLDAGWPFIVTREWAWGGSTGAGVRVCVVDSGIEPGHPRVGDVQLAVSVRAADDRTIIEADTAGDLSGHGTACAGIIRELAPACELVSVRVLGERITGAGDVLLAGLRWAIDQGFEVINLSLSTRRRRLLEALHELADHAYFKRQMIVASAHNLLVESFPWRFASVLSVASHERTDPFTFIYNPDPPVEFFGRGVNVEVAWHDRQVARMTGNSFAAPHLAGLCALILAKHPELTPFELKSVLYLTADNVASTPRHDLDA